MNFKIYKSDINTVLLTGFGYYISKHPQIFFYIEKLFGKIYNTNGSYTEIGILVHTLLLMLITFIFLIILRRK